MRTSLLPENASKSLFALLSVNFLLFGTSMTIFGATIPEIIRMYDWSYSQTGLVLAASSVGYFLSSFASGFLIRKTGPRALITSTLIIEGLSFLFFARFPSIALNTGLNFLIGFGQGGTEVVSNVAIIRMERDGKSRLMNLLHAGFCVGAFLGPVAVAGLINTVVGWRTIFPIVGIIILASAGALGMQQYPGADHTDRLSTGNRGAIHSARRMLLGIYTILILLYVGVELSMSNWSAEFFVTRLDSTSEAGALMVAVLWLGLFVGRIGLSVFYHGKRQELVLLALNIASTSFILLMLLSHSVVASSIFVFLIGIGLSGVYPLVMSLVGKATDSTVAVGMVSTGGGIGSFSFPFILAYLADRTGLYQAFYFCFFVGAAMVLLNLIVAVMFRVRQKTTV